ncbi:MAG: hypothetical protein H6908_04825 [Hyphomicrobiales bacterium]|nr:hypothetical protein [Rickettsiales bacterium]MCP5361946.1 hypothetical protein [Hyphomicrobiales bacterium]
MFSILSFISNKVAAEATHGIPEVAEQCDAMRPAIMTYIMKMNVCTHDAECTAITNHTRCPGRNVLIPIATGYKDYAASVMAAFGTLCGRCDEGLIVEPSLLRCINKKCMIMEDR